MNIIVLQEAHREGEVWATEEGSVLKMLHFNEHESWDLQEQLVLWIR